MNRKGSARRVISLLLALLMLMTVAQAEKLTFPAALEQIEAEAFMGDKAITSVELPDGMTALGDRAFADCTKLKTISIPSSVTSLGADLLKGCPSDVLIKTTAGSAAVTYARQNHIDYQAGTVYRALLVGQIYSGESALDGPANDIVAMAMGLQNFSGTEYDAWFALNLLADQFADAIAEAFEGATEQDVSLFYYSGHGDSDGSLVGSDLENLSPSYMRQLLDTVPGRKIIIIDACYSGKMIDRSGKAARGSDEGSAEDFVNSFMAAFTSNSKASDLRGSEYFVITASAGNQLSYERYGRGIFTQAFLKGCGYDYANEKNTSLHADTNSNNIVTLQEAYDYAKTAAQALLNNKTQTAQVYPDNCNWFGIFRK